MIPPDKPTPAQPSATEAGRGDPGPQAQQTVGVASRGLSPPPASEQGGAHEEATSARSAGQGEAAQVSAQQLEQDKAGSASIPAAGAVISAAGSDAPVAKGLAETIVGKLLDPKSLVKDAVAAFARLYDKNPRAFGLTAVAVMVVTVGARVAGVDVLAFVPQLARVPTPIERLPVVRDVTWVGDLADYRECIAKAKELSRKYVMLNVLQWIQYEDSAAKDVRVIEQRIVYTVLPLVDIAESDQVFAEDYQGSGTTLHWYGPRRETSMPGTSRYQVSFAGKRGIPLSVVTGARMTYPLPFAPLRQGFRQQLAVGSNQDFWAYENTEDVICEITQVIDSRSLRLVQLGRGGHRVGEDGKHIEGDVLSQPVTVPPTPNSALSATWRLVIPGEDVGLAFGW